MQPTVFCMPIKIHQSKVKCFEIKPYPLCLVNISKKSANNDLNKLGLRGTCRISLSAMIPLMILVLKIITII